RNVVRDNILINPTGRKGHFIPVDLNIEHLIRKLKKLHSLNGSDGGWGRLADISASIIYLEEMKKHCFESMNTAYHGSTHTAAKTEDLVWRIAD
ncbi:hypothetical protein BJ165DRAFT_1326193, partial [Panaeolus papilionaceus]